MDRKTVIAIPPRRRSNLNLTIKDCRVVRQGGFLAMTKRSLNKKISNISLNKNLKKMKKEEIYQKDYALLGMSLFVTIVVSCVVFFSAIMADTFSVSFLSLLKVNNQDINVNLNLTMIAGNITILIVLLVVLYILAFMILKYLEHGFQDGIFYIPYKKDIYGKKLVKRRTPIQDFMYGLGCYLN